MRNGLFNLSRENLKIDIKPHHRGQQKFMSRGDCLAGSCLNAIPLILHGFKYFFETKVMFFKHPPDIISIPISAGDSRAIVFCQYGSGFFVRVSFFVGSFASQCIIAIRQPHDQCLDRNFLPGQSAIILIVRIMPGGRILDGSV